MKVAEHRKRWAFDLRQAAGLLWPRWSRRVDALQWSARYRSWLVKHRPSVYPTRNSLYKGIRVATFRDEPILFLEFGVYEGDSMRLWTKIANHADSRFWGFDSFEGLPESEPPFMEGSFGEIEPPTFEDERVQLVPGLFTDTLPKRQWLAEWPSEDHPRLVIHIDCDLYSSTLYALTMLDQFMAPGTIIIFDETSAAEHEFRALIDWTTAYRRSYHVLGGFRSGQRVEGVAIQIRE